MPGAVLTRFRRWHILVGALVATAALTLSGVAGQADRSIDAARFAAWLRPASGRVVVVEMDAASIAAIQRWPWPRGHYAAVVERLQAAGAASVTFDVDVSSPSTPDGDAAFARSLARADGLVALPTFSQAARSGDRRSIDSLPIPILRDHVALASVSMQPDPDGVVRRAPLGTITAGLPRPSMSAYIAHRSATVDSFFPINFAIDPATLPRLSFIAVRDGRFDPAAIRGRDVIVGATAIEMGDRYATPHWGVIPGVVVQALATETLLRGIPVEGSAWTVIAIAALLGAAVLRCRGWMAVATGVLAPALLFAGVVAMQAGWNLTYPFSPGAFLLCLVLAGVGALRLVERVERERSVDADTGLPNRRVMVRDLAADDVRVAVAAIGNFDNLRTVLGERAGRDLMLRLVDRLRLGTGTVYRLGDRLLGFAIDRDVDLVEHFAGLRALLLQPVEVAGRQVDAAVHIGVADDGGTIGDRLANASRAADEAVAEGRFWQCSVVDLVAIERQLILMGELDQAIASGEITVHYQPKLMLSTDRIASAEALVRWAHPTRGMIRPDLFIPLAEQADRIAPLTLCVLDRVIEDLASWRAQGLDLTVAVNMSARLVGTPEFSAAVKEVILSGRVPPEALILEVTESATLSDPERAIAALREWRALGVAISMDDYGTGQSTLTYLRELPLAELKIDRSFVQHAHRNEADAVMVRSTVDLAHDLGLRVVAEGIEEEGCLAFLRDIGCDVAQGYLIGRPVPAGDLLALLSEREAA